jgi:hypothetical protein
MYVDDVERIEDIWRKQFTEAQIREWMLYPHMG